MNQIKYPTLPKSKPYDPNINANTFLQQQNELHVPNQLPDTFSSPQDREDVFTENIHGDRIIRLGSEYGSWGVSDIISNFDEYIRQQELKTIKSSSVPPKLSKEDEELLNDFIRSHTSSVEIKE